MGAVEKIRELVVGNDVERLAAQVAAVEAKITQATAELENVTQRAGSVDDEDAKAFGKITSDIAAARARVDALKARHGALCAALEKVQSAQSQAAEVERQKELAALQEEIARRTQALTSKTRAFASTLADEQAALRELAEKVSDLVPAGDVKTVHRLTRDVPWLQSGRVLEIADRALGGGR